MNVLKRNGVCRAIFRIDDDQRQGEGQSSSTFSEVYILIELISDLSQNVESRIGVESVAGLGSTCFIGSAHLSTSA